MRADFDCINDADHRWKVVEFWLTWNYFSVKLIYFGVWLDSALTLV
jgi:hypothetical protein